MLCIVLMLAGLPIPFRAEANDVGNGAALLRAIKAQKLEETVGVLNEIKQAKHRGDVLPLILDLWNNERRKLPEIPWDFVNLDAVRVEVANVLVQAYRNEQVDIGRPAVHAYVKKIAMASTDVQARSSAVVVLGIIDDSRDVPTLRSAATDERQLVSNSALASLGMMCNREAGKALGALVAAPRSKEFLERARDALELHMQMVKARAGWCARRPFMVSGS